MITCDEIMHVMDIVSTKMTNAIATNVSINSDGKKVRYKIDSYILHTVLLVIILLLIITILCYCLHIRFDKVDEFFRIYDGNKYLALFGSEKYYAIYNRIRYVTILKSSITDIFLTITRKSKLILMILYLWKKG